MIGQNQHQSSYSEELNTYKNRGWFGEVSLIAAAMNQISTLRMRPERIHSQA